MSIISELEMSNKVADKLENDLKREILKNYKQTNIRVKGMFSDLYQKYEADGVLTYSEMSKYNRLKGVQDSVNSEITKLYRDQRNQLNSKLRDVYEDSYMRTGYAIEGDLQAKLSYVLLDPNKIKHAIQNPISGLTLNETLSKNRIGVISKINQEITQGLIKGESYGKMSKRISKVFGGDAGKAIRVAQTETHRVHNQASYDSVIHADDLGVKMKKVWISTFDGSTRDAHQSLDGRSVDPKADFFSSAGGSGPSPGNMRNAGDDINCRCTFIIEVEGVTNKFRRVRDEGIIKNFYENKDGTVVRRTYDNWAKDRGVAPINPNRQEYYSKAVKAYRKAEKLEPQISKDVTKFGLDNKMDQVGYDYRLKTEHSYLDKMSKEYDPNGYSASDIVRYTFTTNGDDLAVKINSTIKTINESGYKTIKIKNTWGSQTNPYRGVNCNFESPTGQIFEVQFHTPESFALKDGPLHVLYEKQRVLDEIKKADEIKELSRQMFELSDKLSVPKNIIQGVKSIG